MRAFIFKAMLFGLVNLALGVTLLLPYHGMPNAYMAASRDKYDRLAAAPSPRLVFVGGSNLAFGLDCETIAEALPGYHPVNMALHADIPVPVMLGQIEPHLRDGDILILSLEYRTLCQPPDGRTLWQYLEHNPAAARELSWAETRLLLDSARPHLSRALKFVGRTIADGEPPSAHDPYSRRSFNAFGDVVAHRSLPPRKALRVAEPVAPAFSHFTAERVELLNDTTARLGAGGIRVVLIHPPVAQISLADGGQAVRRLDQRLRARLTAPVLNDPSEMFLADDLFYDTNYHLNGRGVPVRTRHVIERLSAFLGAPEPTQNSLAAHEAGFVGQPVHR